MTAPMERIQVLDSIEKDIITCLNSAGQVFSELSKEKSSLKQAENHTQTFLKTLGSVENKLTDQINYLTQVSTGQPHEGSGYASQKVLQMAWHRLEHARSRVNELEKRRTAQPQRLQTQTQLQSGASLSNTAMNVPQIQSQST
ncbi:mediator of RNA polymerase II transcription subunit 11 isoform X2 [Sitophilus oryzae]|uniref:Mediator of RNA polymerase II transcription subunit 11 n=1 Tax=Sitophilus oryzae TaxID=7048 RepID=A0A6J2Y800_SITOR|nr:mediator of RNA polymerase II transcription subunit 11 isoform X2 [Sitophilus oryzae]